MEHSAAHVVNVRTSAQMQRARLIPRQMGIPIDHPSIAGLHKPRAIFN
jgi:hypothetical protein